MKRIIVLSSLVTSAVWVALTTLAIIVVFPAIAGAQAALPTIPSTAVIGADGKELVLLGAPPAGTDYDCVDLLGVEGRRRASMCSGGNGNPANTGLNLYTQEGQLLARIGTVASSGGGRPWLLLADAQGRRRLVEQLDDDGNASIQLLDADGNVVWSAP